MVLIPIRGWVDPQGHRAIGSIASTEEYIDLFGIQIHIILTYIIVHQPGTLYLAYHL
jgi:hypothetical protein